MADQHRSALEVLEGLGVPPSDHEFLRRLFSSEYPFPGPSNAELDPTAGNRGSARLSAASLANTLAPLRIRQVIPRALVAVLD